MMNLMLAVLCVTAAPTTTVAAQQACACQGRCPCHAQASPTPCAYCPGGGGGGSTQKKEEGPSPVMEREAVRLRVHCAEEADSLIKGVSKARGVEEAKFENGVLSFLYSGKLGDLLGLEKSLAKGKRRAYLISPARVHVALGGGADPAALRSTLLKQKGIRYVDASKGMLEVWSDLDVVCAHDLTSAARAAGFTATLQSHTDLSIAVSSGDLVTALLATDGVIRAEDDKGTVHVLAAGKLKKKDVEKIAAEAGATIGTIEER